MKTPMARRVATGTSTANRAGLVLWCQRPRNGSPVIYSIIESTDHPNLSGLYRRLGLEELRLASQRRALQALKTRPPDWVVADFF